MSNVVGINGCTPLSSGEPIQEVVDLLEEALAKAKAGKLDGVAIITSEWDPAAFDVVYYAARTKHRLAAGVMTLQWKMAQRMAE